MPGCSRGQSSNPQGVPNGSGVTWLRVDRGANGNSSGVISRALCGHQQSEAEPRKDVARRATRLKPRYALVGSRRLPLYDGTTSAADETADADHDGGHQETRAGGRESGTAVCEPHGAGSRHGDAERNDGLAEADGSLDDRDSSKGRTRTRGQGIAHGRDRTGKTNGVECSRTSRSGSSEQNFRLLIKSARESDSMLSKSDIKQVFVSKADEIDQTEEVHRKNGQLCLAMVASTDERSQVLVTGSATGHGVEAWEKARAAMGSLGSRAKSCTLQGNRCKLGLRAMIEKCESSVRKYEKDEKGEPLKLVGGLKMTAFESMLLYDLEDPSRAQQEEAEHVQRNRRRKSEGIMDARIGDNVKELVMRFTPRGGRAGRGDPMDVDVFQEGKYLGKCKEEPQKFEGLCFPLRQERTHGRWLLEQYKK